MLIVFRNRYKYIFIIAVILVGYLVYSTAILTGFKPNYHDYDPEMAYFMNSLAAFKGAPYYYTDHPGTPIEIAGTILLGTTYVFFANRSSFINYYLQHPELFLNMAHAFITLLSVLCAIYFFLTAFGTLQGKNAYLAISLALLFYGLHPYSFTTLTVWSHTSFNFPLGAGYLILLYTVAYNRQGQISNRLALGLGLVLGIMIAVMINFFPWLISTLIFIILSNHMKRMPWKQSLVTGSIILLACVVSFLVSVLPAIDRMPYFFELIYKLFTHQLPYGNGPEGITSIPLLWNNMIDMVSAAPLVFLAMLAGLLISIFIFLQRASHAPENHSLWALNFSLLLQCAMITLAVLKHPGERFLLSLTATIPVLFLVNLKLSDFNGTFSRHLSNVLIVFSVISISAFAILSIRNRNAELLETRAIETEINQVIAEQKNLLSKKRGKLLILRTNATYSFCSARLYGDFYTTGVFAKEINALCPSQAYFFYQYNWVLYRGKHVAVDDLPWDMLITRTSSLESNPAWKQKGTIYEYPYDISLVIRKK